MIKGRRDALSKLFINRVIKKLQEVTVDFAMLRGQAVARNQQS